MHEESDTIQRKDGRWINIYGKGKHRTGQLPASKDYGTVEEAVAAAKQRSAEHTEPDAHTHGPRQPRGTMGMSDLMAQTIAKGNITGPTGGQKTGLPQMMQPVLGPGQAELSMGTPHEAAGEPQGRYSDMPPGKGLGALLDVAKMKMTAAPDFDPLAYLNQEQMSGPWAEANARQSTVKATPPAEQARPGEFKDVSGQMQQVYQEGKAGTFKDVNGKQQKVYQDAPLTDMSDAITKQHQTGMGMMK